jgi:hypothetical protein
MRDMHIPGAPFQNLNGIVNSTSGRMDQERFITINRACGVLQYVKRLGGLFAFYQ